MEVGSVTNGEVTRAASMGSAFRDQWVVVNGRVFGGSGEAAGIVLNGGGLVWIQSQGSVGAASGIAILATGNTPGMDGGSAVGPSLRVDLDLDGRRLAEVIGDDWIINDGGGTTIRINGRTLHDGATGATDAVIANGAWDIWMEPAGVRVEDRSDPDPANWVVSPRFFGLVLDRDFSVADFIEVDGSPGPMPEPEPEPLPPPPEPEPEPPPPPPESEPEPPPAPRHWSRNTLRAPPFTRPCRVSCSG